MSIDRLGGIKPGRLGIFAGSLSAQPASVQRDVAKEMENLGYGTLWYGAGVAREAFAQAGIFLGATSTLVIASGIANIWARDPMAMVAGVPYPKHGRADSSWVSGLAMPRWSLREDTTMPGPSARCASIWTAFRRRSDRGDSRADSAELEASEPL